jgi:hypothetical protein
MSSKTIRTDVIYFYGIPSILFIFPAFIVGMALVSPIFQNEKLSSLARNFLFFASAIAIFYGTSYLITAKCLITLNDKGISLKITKWGLGMWLSERFYLWSEIESFNKEHIKGRMQTQLKFADKRCLTFSDDRRELYLSLKQYLSKKEA